MAEDGRQRQGFSERMAAALGGCAAVGLVLAGGIGLFMSWFHFTNLEGGVGLVAAALAFGFLINAVFRR